MSTACGTIRGCHSSLTVLTKSIDSSSQMPRSCHVPAAYWPSGKPASTGFVDLHRPPALERKSSYYCMDYQDEPGECVCAARLYFSCLQAINHLLKRRSLKASTVRNRWSASRHSIARIIKMDKVSARVQVTHVSRVCRSDAECPTTQCHYIRYRSELLGSVQHAHEHRLRFG
jgi:hypothetical protein